MLTNIYIDEDFLDLIDQAFLEGQIDGEMSVLAGRCVRHWPERTANNQLELLPTPGFLRKIAVTDDSDPHVVLEKLHETWANATEETEAAWHALMANPLDQTLRDDYFEKQQLSIQAGQDILEHKLETGV